MKGERLAWPLSAVSLIFSALALPLTYFLIPYCSPSATPLDLGATVGITSLASVLAIAAILVSLLSVYTLGNHRSRLSLALSGTAMGLATVFLVFGLVLRPCAI